MKKPLLLAGSAGLLAGVAVGYALSGGWAEPLPGSTDAERAAAEVAAKALGEIVALQQENAELRAENERIRSNPDQRTALAEPETPVDLAAILQGARIEMAEPDEEPVVSFGAWAGEPALRKADWVDMGIRARDVVTARGSGIGGRQPALMGALEKKAIRELGDQIDRIEAERPALAGHPVVVVNIMASHLEQAGKPFQPWQIESIETMGRQYEQQAENLRSAMTQALPSEQKFHSILLRKNVVDRIVNEVLTGEQWDLLFDKETKGLCYYDVYQVGGLELERPYSSVYWRHVRADAVEHLKSFMLTEWEIPGEDVHRFDDLVEEWIDAIMALPKFQSHPSSAMHIDEILPCVEVHIEFQKRVLTMLSGEVADKVRNNTVYAVFPQLRA